ncbi:MAG: hypothetical protein RQ866_05895, partial [Bacteroidales bacterium]|nr:hypothetical protein [Bacteroidales bacterium]
MKLETHAWQVAPFVKALIYSLVYSGAFVAIYLTGAILATKLPAYTATRLAECIDPGSNNNVTADRFIETIVMLFRSQFVAFVGNLLAAIVVAIAIARLWVLAFPMTITSDYGATVLVKEINLLHTPTIFFSAIASQYLFIGGLVTGHYENKLLFARIPERIRAIGEDERFGSKKRNFLIWLSKYIEHHMGKINGNITMGFLFGFTVLIGYIFGFWLDVRHIAFASANIGFAIADNPEIFTTKVIIENAIAL